MPNAVLFNVIWSVYVFLLGGSFCTSLTSIDIAFTDLEISKKNEEAYCNILLCGNSL